MKLEELQMGVVDLFAVLLPGGALVAYLEACLGLRVRLTEARILPDLTDPTAAWVAFGLFAYGTGHLVLIVGSRLDVIYDRVRERRWPRRDGDAYSRARALRNHHLGSRHPSKPMSTFEWALAVLSARHPSGRTAVARLVADQKFFRSLVVVLPLVGAAELVRFVLGLGLGRPEGFLHLGVALASAGAAALAFITYLHRRRKSTESAYQLVLALEPGRGAPSELETVELRWFFDAPVPVPSLPAPPSVEHRTDMYLTGTGGRLGVKLRGEDAIACESKRRVDAHPSRNGEGPLEVWVKRPLDYWPGRADDPSAWVPVRKRRWSWLLAADSGRPRWTSARDADVKGSLEITELRVDETRAWSVAVEVSADLPDAPGFVEQVIAELDGWRSTWPRARWSGGYPGWLEDRASSKAQGELSNRSEGRGRPNRVDPESDRPQRVLDRTGG